MDQSISKVGFALELQKIQVDQFFAENHHHDRAQGGVCNQQINQQLRDAPQDTDKDDQLNEGGEDFSQKIQAG